MGSFPACWRKANVTPISKGPPPSSVANCRPISITSVLSKVFERLVSVRLGRFMERSGVLPTTQFAYRKGLGTSDAHLCDSHTLKIALESGQEARIVQIDFKHRGILYKFCSMGIGGSLLSILTQFLSNRSQHMLWWTVNCVNWIMLCQECTKELFLARYCSSCSPLSFFPFWRLS